METAGPADRRFRWASVTKLLVALAALDAVQRGLLALDEPAGPPGSTIRHLLSHASGLAFDGDAVLARPGTRRIYSNRGIEIVADLIAARSGQPFERLLADEICLPLGMAGTRLEGSPAWGAVGPLADLMNLAVELASPSLVDEDLLAEATRTAFPGLSGVLPGFGRQPRNDWGLGFEIRDSKTPHWTGSANSPRTFGHFGQSGSFLWVDPDARMACAALADRDFGDWAKQAWPRLSDDLLAAHAALSPYAELSVHGRQEHVPRNKPYTPSRLSDADGLQVNGLFADASEDREDSPPGWPSAPRTARQSPACAEPLRPSRTTPIPGFLVSPGARAGMLMAGTDAAQRRRSWRGGRQRCPRRFRAATSITCGSP